MNPFSRRKFIGTSALVSQAAAAGQVAPSALTAGEVVNRIKQHVGVPWRSVTVDQIIAGDESTPVHGIASVMMAPLEVVERAAAEGKNMIVTHETPYYLHQDKIDEIRENPVLQYKQNFLRQHNMAIFHFHDHWHMRHLDGIAEGMLKELGWEKYVEDPANPKRFTFPERHSLSLRREFKIAFMRERCGSLVIRIFQSGVFRRAGVISADNRESRRSPAVSCSCFERHSRQSQNRKAELNTTDCEALQRAAD